MARTAKRVSDLVEEDPGMADAVAVVLERAEDGSVTWADVNDELTSGQWGRLIQTDVLHEDGGEGFVVRDPEGVREALEDGSGVSVATPSVDDDGESSWSIYDKAAAVGSLGLFAGYSLQEVRAVIGGTLDLLLGPLDAVLPFYAVILVLALFTGLYSTLLQANLMDMSKMSQYQEQMQAIQEKRKQAKERGDDEELERIQQEQMEAMGDQLGMFKEQFRPMVWIMLLTIPVFLWMYWMILDGHVSEIETHITMPLIGQLGERGWRTGVLGPIQAWIVWYFVCSMAFTQVIRKALNIQTTPT